MLVMPTPKLGRNTLVLLANNALTGGLAFVYSAIIGRVLGAEGLGQYVYIVAWVTPWVAFADFGLGTLITRDVARDATTNPDAIPALIHAITRAFLPLNALIWGIGLLAAALSGFNAAILTGIVLITALILLDPWFGLYTALFRAYERMMETLYLNSGGAILQVILSLIAMAAGAGVTGVIAAVVITNILQLIGAWGLWRTSAVWRRLPPNIPIPAAKTLIARTAPFAVSALIGALSARLNVLLLERLTGDVAVGYYGAASRFLEGGRIIPNAVFGALLPALSALMTQPILQRQTFRRAWIGLTGFGLIFAGFVTLFAEPLLRLAFGEQFTGAAAVLIALGWAFIPSIWRSLMMLSLFSRGQESLTNWVTIGMLAIQTLIGIPMMTAYGAVGAALTLLGVEALGTLLLGIAGRSFPR
jgi:O-antigen/teichoic acid export membrane protein